MPLFSGNFPPHPVLGPSECICFSLWAYLCPYPNQQAEVGGGGGGWTKLGHNPFWWLDGCTWHRVGISEYAYAIAEKVYHSREGLPTERKNAQNVEGN